jgi:hypothetical protein
MRRAVIAALAVSTAMLTACTNQAGAAALVGDVVFSETQVQADTAEVLGAADAAGGIQVENAAVAREQVRRLVTEELVELAAAEQGVEVTAGDVDRSIAQVAATTPGGVDALELQLATQNGVPPSALESFVRTFLLQQELVAATGAPPGLAEQQYVSQLAELSDEVGVSISPRYGEWVPTELRVAEPPFDLAAPPTT